MCQKFFFRFSKYDFSAKKRVNDIRNPFSNVWGVYQQYICLTLFQLLMINYKLLMHCAIKNQTHSYSKFLVVHGRWAYECADIRWGARFSDIISLDEEGVRTIDYNRFHEVSEG